jgi:aerobic-type carbon monoxide dehydrogenase small subunit (CoxS/CutS family)
MPALKINGEVRTFDAPDDIPLLWVLRDVLGMTGTKFGCGIAQCGACTVHVDGNPVRSCLLPVGSIGEKPITTIEGIGATPIGATVQKAWLDLEVIQCGYCHPARSCRRQLCWRSRLTLTIPISMPQWRAISAVAAPTYASARRSSALQANLGRRRPRHVAD